MFQPIAEPSGPLWVARFPTSVSLDDLIEPFRSNITVFIYALQGAGAAVDISATWRPAERAWLMHWACMIAKSGQDPAAIPARDGIEIDWTHGGDLDAARQAAAEMVEAYGIAFPAALESRHTQRRAVDMTIRFRGMIGVRDARGNERHAASQSDLWPIGASFGVIKLPSDPPHWSDDGH